MSTALLIVPGVRYGGLNYWFITGVNINTSSGRNRAEHDIAGSKDGFEPLARRKVIPMALFRVTRGPVALVAMYLRP